MRALYSAGSASRPTRSRMRNGSALHTTTSAASSSPVASTTPLTRPPSMRSRSTRLSVSMTAPCSRALSASMRVTVPMPPLTIIHVPSEPGSRHMLWTRKFMPGAGRVPRAVEAGEPVGDGVHRAHQVALEARSARGSRRPACGTDRRTPGAAPGARTSRRSPRSTAAPPARCGATSSRILPISSVIAWLARQSGLGEEAR